MTFTYTPNLKNFYDHIRPMFTTLTQKQVDGIEAILKAFSGYDLRYAAYALATAFHETGRTMQPIREYGRGQAYDYGKKLKMSRKPYDKPDQIYYGRGLVQLTWYENYNLMGLAAQRKGMPWDFLNNPDLMLQMEPSVWVMRYGMLNGSFTGKKLSDYFDGAKEQPISARKIINGSDKASTIAGYYETFKLGLLK